MDQIKMKELLNRLLEWLAAHGMTAEEMIDCIDYITRTAAKEKPSNNPEKK